MSALGHYSFDNILVTEIFGVHPKLTSFPFTAGNENGKQKKSKFFRPIALFVMIF